MHRAIAFRFGRACRTRRGKLRRRGRGTRAATNAHAFSRSVATLPRNATACASPSDVRRDTGARIQERVIGSRPAQAQRGSLRSCPNTSECPPTARREMPSTQPLRASLSPGLHAFITVSIVRIIRCSWAWQRLCLPLVVTPENKARSCRRSRCPRHIRTVEWHCDKNITCVIHLVCELGTYPRKIGMNPGLCCWSG